MKAEIITEESIKKQFGQLDRDEWSVLPKECLESLCVYAIRYCQGRWTHAPHDVLPVAMANIKLFSDKTLYVLISDYEYAKQRGELGDPEIDAPVWEDYASKLYAERDRRKGLA